MAKRDTTPQTPAREYPALEFRYDREWNAGSILAPTGSVAAIERSKHCEALGMLFAASPDLRAALIEAKREMWSMCRHQWNLSDFKNFAVIQQIDAALQKADGMERAA